jgi:hypothetical protein
MNTRNVDSNQNLGRVNTLALAAFYPANLRPFDNGGGVET